MSQQSSQNSQSQSDQDMMCDDGLSIHTLSFGDGPYESCFECENEALPNSHLCMDCLAATVLVTLMIAEQDTSGEETESESEEEVMD